jgi:acid phosphatase type 7
LRNASYLPNRVDGVFSEIGLILFPLSGSLPILHPSVSHKEVRAVLTKTILLAGLVCLVSLAPVACARASTEGGSRVSDHTLAQGSSGQLASSEPSATSGGPPVVVAAGDIADCHSRGDEATARLLGSIHGTILTLGDEAYEEGSPEEFANCYGPTWGRFKERTKPAPGNHEYATPNAEGYFGYFGKAAGNAGEGYYSFDLGDWHLIALNSNCAEVGGCTRGSAQGRWLRRDLANHPSRCTLAYFHHPLFTSGEYSPGVPEVRPLWKVLYKAGADVILNGHDHNYQRFAPQDPEGKADPERGIMEFVVGTGGRRLYAIESPIANVQRYDDDTIGVLKLTLLSGSYDWKFVPVAGQSFLDSGTTSCH